MARWLGCLGLVLALMGPGSLSARADLVYNGSFEEGAWGWSGTHGVEVYPTWQYGLSDFAGTQNAEVNTDTYSTISQVITDLTIGQRYLLGWAYAGRTGSGPQQMNVLFDGVMVGQNTDDGIGPKTWLHNQTVITAMATSALLSFAAVDLGGHSDLGNELDGVSLTTYVPEPSTMLLLPVGLALALLARRARRKGLGAGVPRS